MKIRNDFVSNSSSSSFILANEPVFTYFKIEKQDIIDALAEIYGIDNYSKYVMDKLDKMAKDPEYYEFDRKYSNVGPFYVYDMTIEADRKEAEERWGTTLAEWEATHCETDFATGELRSQFYHKEFTDICEGIRQIFNLNDFYDNKLSKDDTMRIRTNRRNADGTYGHDVKVPGYLVTFVEELRKRSGVIDNLELLKNEASRFFVHFDENEMWTSEMEARSKNDEDVEKYNVNDEKLAFGFGSRSFPDNGENEKREDVVALGKKIILEHNKYADERNRERDNSIYESESYSEDRFFEVLFNVLVKRGKIDPKSKEFLETFYKLDQDDWRKDAEYDTVNGHSFSYEDLQGSCLTFVGHEG